VIIIPETLEQVQGKVQDMERLRLSYLRNAAKAHPVEYWNDNDISFLADDLKVSPEWILEKRSTL